MKFEQWRPNGKFGCVVGETNERTDILHEKTYYGCKDTKLFESLFQSTETNWRPLSAILRSRNLRINPARESREQARMARGLGVNFPAIGWMPLALALRLEKFRGEICSI